MDLIGSVLSLCDKRRATANELINLQIQEATLDIQSRIMLKVQDWQANNHHVGGILLGPIEWAALHMSLQGTQVRDKRGAMRPLMIGDVKEFQGKQVFLKSQPGIDLICEPSAARLGSLLYRKG